MKKLVRDKIPAIILAKGQKQKTYIAKEQEYRQKLLDKL